MPEKLKSVLVPRQKAAQARVQAEEVLRKSPEAEKAAMAPRERDEVLAESPRLPFRNDKITGTVNLRGGRVDDLTLTKYRETIDPKSPAIVLFSPAGSALPYAPFYAEFGWLSNDAEVKLPTNDSLWRAENQKLSPDGPVNLSWDNGAGLSFERTLSLDKDYLFTVTEKVRNASGREVTLYPYGLISRHGTPHTLGYATLHEGPLGVLGNTLHEKTYKKLHEEPLYTQPSEGGWIGVTDVYWLAGVVADPKDKITGRFLYSLAGAGQERYQADMQKNAVTLKPSEESSSTFHLFAGAKEVAVLDAYTKSIPAPMFDRAIDFGWFYFIAKPFFLIIDFLARYLGNYGLAIILFTVVLRLLFYPMSESSYRNMERMKALQPQMNKLKERHANDPMKMNEEVTALYKKEKLNPLSGCIPVLVQIPVFFALYKVLLVSIEMRHAPFYGWIRDLSAPDPSNLFTLFGLIHWAPPAMLHLGVLPLLMGSTMFIQQKLSPPPGDKVSQQIFTFMPIMFTFLLANMSAGLVLYWTFSNLLAIMQQTLIKHRIKSPAPSGAK
ncbi:MAG: membrane protein insertase YidC [Proteobacteria bacterium]|nr:membrane protein insertase YidC [Pseudomonadota bacterium]